MKKKQCLEKGSWFPRFLKVTQLSIGVALPRMATMAVITFILLSEIVPMHNI